METVRVETGVLADAQVAPLLSAWTPLLRTTLFLGSLVSAQELQALKGDSRQTLVFIERGEPTEGSGTLGLSRS